MKAGTATKLVLNILTTGAMIRLGQDLRQPHGGPAGPEPEAGRPRRADRDGGRRGGPRRGRARRSRPRAAACAPPSSCSRAGCDPRRRRKRRIADAKGPPPRRFSATRPRWSRLMRTPLAHRRPHVGHVARRHGRRAGPLHTGRPAPSWWRSPRAPTTRTSAREVRAAVEGRAARARAGPPARADRRVGRRGGAGGAARRARVRADEVDGIAFHGQTIWHEPPFVTLAAGRAGGAGGGVRRAGGERVPRARRGGGRAGGAAGADGRRAALRGRGPEPRPAQPRRDGQPHPGAGRRAARRAPSRSTPAPAWPSSTRWRTGWTNRSPATSTARWRRGHGERGRARRPARGPLLPRARPPRAPGGSVSATRYAGALYARAAGPRRRGHRGRAHRALASRTRCAAGRRRRRRGRGLRRRGAPSRAHGVARRGTWRRPAGPPVRRRSSSTATPRRRWPSPSSATSPCTASPATSPPPPAPAAPGCSARSPRRERRPPDPPRAPLAGRHRICPRGRRRSTPRSTFGAGGFILFGGTARGGAWSSPRSCRTRAGRPLLLASDLERGAGQQFPGLTEFPPPASARLARRPRRASARRAATHRASRRSTRRHQLGPGARWPTSTSSRTIPSCRRARSAATPRWSRADVAAWVAGCQEAGALACVKHFPGTRPHHAATATTKCRRWMPTSPRSRPPTWCPSGSASRRGSPRS